MEYISITLHTKTMEKYTDEFLCTKTSCTPIDEYNLYDIDAIFRQNICTAQDINSSEFIEAAGNYFYKIEKKEIDENKKTLYTQINRDGKKVKIKYDTRDETPEEKQKKTNNLLKEIDIYKNSFNARRTMLDSFASIEKEMSQRHGESPVYKMNKLELLSEDLEIIELYKYKNIGVNARTLVYASLFNGFSLLPGVEIIEKIYSNDLADDTGYSEEGVYCVYNPQSIKKCKNKLIKKIKNDKSIENDYILKIAIRNPIEELDDDTESSSTDDDTEVTSTIASGKKIGFSISYNSIINSDIRNLLNPIIEKSLHISINNYAVINDDLSRKLIVKSSSGGSDIINIHDSIPFLACFNYLCDEYDCKIYPKITGKKVKPCSSYYDSDSQKGKYHRAKSIEKYMDIVTRTYELYNTIKSKSFSDNRFVRLSIINQLWRLNDMFGIIKTVKLFEYYKFITSNTIIERLCEIFKMSSPDQITHIIEEYIFKNEVFLKAIYKSECINPLVYFEYGLANKILEYIFNNIFNLNVFKNKYLQDLSELILNTVNIFQYYLDNNLTSPENVKEFFKTNNDKCVFPSVDLNGYLRIEESLKNIYNLFFDEFINYCSITPDIYDDLYDFLKNHSKYSVIQECICNKFDTITSDQE